MTTDAVPCGWGSILETQSEMIEQTHGNQNKKQARLTNSNREIKAVICDLRIYAKVLKISQNQSPVIGSNNNTAVYDIWKLRSIILLKEIKPVHQTVAKLGIQIQITHLPGVKNEIADALSRLSRAGDYKLKEKIFQQKSVLKKIRDEQIRAMLMALL
ncbi:MAG: hypothetical protein EZS28_023846 [Streblomastix strix]|uniref:RNase H type-1 domain-containing protein n=1 Tax=Streblomastix strix TaxID=222440 RepID=A0A5J4VDQ9_9EUKA|nr:MAG: hypothetical protein EZS28_023846 [Streblomastix strix]